MKKEPKSLARKIAVRLLVWGLVLMAGVSYLIFMNTSQKMSALYCETYHHKMLINYEYTRRVLSDVYVQVTNNVYYIEQTLDKPDGQVDVMARIVRQGNRVHSCGMNFIKDYYRKKGHKYCPFAWRNPENPEEILTDEKGDKDFDYLNDRWFKSVIEGDTAEWSEPFLDGYDNKTALAAYMVPIHEKSGRPVAVLGADISLDWMTAKLAETDSTYNAQSAFFNQWLDLESQSFIINYDGTFITHPDEQHRMRGIFYDFVRGHTPQERALLLEEMKGGHMSSLESDKRYLFKGEDCFLFYTPLKYTNWMMVTVVPCRLIDMQVLAYELKIVAMLLAAILLLVIVAYVYIRIELKKKYETDKLECERPEGV